MSERILVVNVGERDLYYRIDTPSGASYCHFEQGKAGVETTAAYLGCSPWGRLIGEEIHRRLTLAPESEIPRCAFPILDAVMTLVTQEAPLDRVILIATDQSLDTPARFRDRDTIFSAKIAGRIIETQRKARVRLVEIRYYRQVPAREQAYEFYGTLLGPLADRRAELHACVSGGIPALNAALQEQAFRLFRGRGSFLYEVVEGSAGAPDKPPHSAARVVAPEPFLRDFVTDMIERLLARYDYSGALDLLRAYRDAADWDQGAEQLLAYAERRVNLDMKGAAQALEPSGARFAQWRAQVRNSNSLNWALETLSMAGIRDASREYAEVAWRIRAILDEAQVGLPTPTVGDDKTAKPHELLASAQARKLNRLANKILHERAGASSAELEGAIGFLKEILHAWAVAEERETGFENPYESLNREVMSMLRSKGTKSPVPYGVQAVQ